MRLRSVFLALASAGCGLAAAGYLLRDLVGQPTAFYIGAIGAVFALGALIVAVRADDE